MLKIEKGERADEHEIRALGTLQTFRVARTIPLGNAVQLMASSFVNTEGDVKFVVDTPGLLRINERLHPPSPELNAYVARLTVQPEVYFDSVPIPPSVATV